MHKGVTDLFNKTFKKFNSWDILECGDFKIRYFWRLLIFNGTKFTNFGLYSWELLARREDRPP